MAYYKNATKYNNVKTTIDGETFDSKKEARRYCKLKLLEKAGEIKCLERQVKYVLIPAQYDYYERYGKKGQKLKDGHTLLEKECSYIADFQYHDARTGKLIVEDTKGLRTKDYIIKRKLMLNKFGIRIEEL